jgi:hypothetical protein
MKFHVDHRFERCRLDRFVAVYFSEHFNTAVATVSGLRTRQLVAETIHPDGHRERRVRMHPQVTLPTAIKRFVSEEQIHYDEVSTYDPTTQVVRFFIDSKANDRVSFRGSIRFVDEGDMVRRIIDAEIVIHAPFGVGAIIEKFIEAEVHKSYDRIRPFLQRYLDEHPSGPADPPAGNPTASEGTAGAAAPMGQRV